MHKVGLGMRPVSRILADNGLMIKSGGTFMLKRLLICGHEDKFASDLIAAAVHNGIAVSHCSDMTAAMNKIKVFLPDVIVSDIILPGGDGIELLCACDDIPVVFVTGFINDAAVRLSVAYGAAYLMQDMSGAGTVLRRISQLCSGRERSLSQEAIAHRRTACAARLLEKSGIRHGRLGFRYAQCAILEMMVQDGTEPMQNVYSRVALRFGTKANCVERSIRSAVEEAWTNGDVAQGEYGLWSVVDKERGKPTNREFLTALCKKLKAEYA